MVLLLCVTERLAGRLCPEFVTLLIGEPWEVEKAVDRVGYYFEA